MQRSVSPRKAGNFSESAHQRRNMDAPATGAAGMGPANVPMRRDSLWSRLHRAAPSGFRVR
jgi:hypothetical protein